MVVILLKWARVGNLGHVKGSVEVYSLDTNGIPILRQTEVLFEMLFAIMKFSVNKV
jgi:hypothetical protein